MRVGPPALLFIGVLINACSSAELRYVAPPDLQDARGVVAVVHTGSGPRAFAVNLEANESWRIVEDVMDDDELGIDLFVYDCPLDAWIAGAADISVAESDGRPLPAAARMFTTSIVDDFAWRSSDEVPARSAPLMFDYAVHQQCSELETETIVPLDTEEELRLVVPLDADHVLVGTTDGAMHVAGRDGVLTPYHAGATVDGDPYVAGFRAESGTVYLMSKGRSCLARVDDATTITRLACLPLGIQSARGSWYDIGGAETAAGLEVIARTDNGRVFVMRAGTDRFEEQLFGAPTGASDKAGLVYTDAGRGFIAGSVPRDVLVYADGTLDREPVEVLPIDIINGIAMGAEFGPVVVSNFGEIFSRPSEEGWRRLGACGIAEARVVAEAGGRVWGGGMGIVAEVGRDASACSGEITLRGKVMRLMSLGGTRMVMTARVDRLAEVHFLRSTAPYVSTCTE